MNAAAATALVIVGAACATGTVTAQIPLYRDVSDTHLPANLAGRCMNAAAGDADDDGDLDLALAMEFEPNVLLLNDGKGRFTDGSNRLPRAAHDSEDVAFADFDRDGDLDLVLVSEDDRKDELYINDGKGRFADASERLATDDVSNALAVLDLNGDGAPDVLTGNIGTDRALINDGRGHFRDETTERWPQDGRSRTQDLELADVDGDGDLDVIVGNEGQDQLFMNDQGRLVDASARGLPVRDDETRKIKAVDVDGDRDLDLVVANVRFITNEPAQNYLLLNDGSGVFTTADTARFPGAGRSHFTIQAVDLDHDGDADVLAPSTVLARTVTEVDTFGDYLVLLNDGSGRFSAQGPGTILPVTAVGNGFDVEVADFDGDGAADLFLCNRASIDDAPAESGGRQRLLLGARPP